MSSPATTGTMPSDTASTTRSKSLPLRNTPGLDVALGRPKWVPSACQSLRPSESDAAQLVGQRSAGKTGRPRICGQRLVVVDPVGEATWRAMVIASIALMRAIQVQGVEAMEEFERTPRLTQYLVERGDDDVAHSCRHLPEERAPVLEHHDTGEQHRQPGSQRGPLGVAILVSEDQIVKGTNQGKSNNIWVGAVAEDPLTEVLVIDGPEPAGSVIRLSEMIPRTIAVSSDRNNQKRLWSGRCSWSSASRMASSGRFRLPA